MYKNEKLRNKLKEEFEKLKGQFVLDYYKVVRLIAIEDVPHDDLFYILTDGKNIYYSSVLTRLIPLKGKLDQRDYDELVRVAKLNALELESPYNDHDHCIIYRTEMEKIHGKYAITDFAWEIN